MSKTCFRHECSCRSPMPHNGYTLCCNKWGSKKITQMWCNMSALPPWLSLHDDGLMLFVTVVQVLFVSKQHSNSFLVLFLFSQKNTHMLQQQSWKLGFWFCDLIYDEKHFGWDIYTSTTLALGVPGPEKIRHCFVFSCWRRTGRRPGVCLVPSLRYCCWMRMAGINRYQELQRVLRLQAGITRSLSCRVLLRRLQSLPE